MVELQQIFIDGADADGDSSPSRHDIYRMKSMGALIKKKLSRDLPRSRSKSSLPSGTVQIRRSGGDDTQGTVVKNTKTGAKLDLKITSEDLKKDLLSDLGLAEGGYDDDALELDDVVKKLGRKTPPRRLSIHSVEWTTPTIKT
jgi:hypothetical protein